MRKIIGLMLGLLPTLVFADGGVIGTPPGQRYVIVGSTTGNIVSNSSITASAFFGNGSGLTGTGEANTFTSSKTFTNNVLMKSSLTASGIFAASLTVSTPILVASGGTGTTNRTLKYASGVTAIDWGGSFIYSQDGIQAVDFNNRGLNDSSGNGVVTWGNSVLIGGGGGFNSVDWGNRILNATNGAVALNWGGAGALTTGSSLTVNGAVLATSSVTASAFFGNGSGLTGVAGTDSTKVAKTGDTMTGQLTIAGSSLTVQGRIRTMGVGGAATPDMNAQVQFSSSVNTNFVVYGSSVIIYNNQNAGSPTIYQGRAFTGSLAAPTAVAALQPLANFAGSGYDGATWVAPSVGVFFCNAGTAWSTINHSSFCGVQTTVGTVTATKAIFGGNGALGLGTKVDATGNFTGDTKLVVGGSSQFGGLAVISTITANGSFVGGLGSSITLSGDTGWFTGASSVTASAFFGNGSGLTGVTSTAVTYAHAGGFSTTLGLGTTFFAFVPDENITLKRITATVVVAGVDGAGDTYRCQDASGNNVEVTVSAAATAGTVTTATGTGNVTSGTQVSGLLFTSTAVTSPVVNILCEYIKQ